MEINIVERRADKYPFKALVLSIVFYTKHLEKGKVYWNSLVSSRKKYKTISHY